LPEPLKLKQEISFKVKQNDKVMNLEILHKQPAFLGEKYAVNFKLQPIEGYQIKSSELFFTEILDNIQRSTSEVKKENDKSKKLSHSRRASVVSMDSNNSENSEWSYLLYSQAPEKDNDSLIERPPHHHYIVPELKDKQENIKLYFQFRVEGRKFFEATLKYTAQKIMPDLTLGPEFILENKAYFNIEVMCPFEFTSEWLTIGTLSKKPEINLGQPNKGILQLNKKATLDIKISTKGSESVLIHQLDFKIKEHDLINHIAHLQESKWENWPVLINPGETFSHCIPILPIAEFKEKQLGDLEIVWTRADDKTKEKTNCTIPISEASCETPILEISAEYPLKGNKLSEFEMCVKFKNTTENIVETKVVLEENENFLISGELQANITFPPYCEDFMKFTLLPIKCGKLVMPKPIVYLIMNGKTTDPIFDKNFEQSIYVFPE